MDKKTINYLKELTKTDDYRDVFWTIGNWAHCQDFTYRDDHLDSYVRFLRAFVVSVFLDLPYPISTIKEIRSEIDDLEMEQEIVGWWKKLGL